MSFDLFDQPPPAGVRDTSKSAYCEHAGSGELSLQKQRMLDFLGANRRAEGWTRAELAQAAGERLSSVCGRVNELIAAGKLLDNERRKCSVSGRTAHILRVA